MGTSSGRSSAFWQISHLVKAAAYADAQHDGRAGVGTGQLDGLQHELPEALHAVGGLEHLDAAHVLAAKALGATVMVQPSPSTR